MREDCCGADREIRHYEEEEAIEPARGGAAERCFDSEKHSKWKGSTWTIASEPEISQELCIFEPAEGAANRGHHSEPSLAYGKLPRYSLTPLPPLRL